MEHEVVTAVEHEVVEREGARNGGARWSTSGGPGLLAPAFGMLLVVAQHYSGRTSLLAQALEI